MVNNNEYITLTLTSWPWYTNMT